MIKFNIMLPKVPEFVRKYNWLVETYCAGFITLACHEMDICQYFITNGTARIIMHERSSTGGGSVPYCSIEASETRAMVKFFSLLVSMTDYLCQRTTTYSMPVGSDVVCLECNEKSTH